MKQLNQIFHDLLIKFIDDRTNEKIEIKEIVKFLYMNEKTMKYLKNLMITLLNIMIFVLILLIKI